MQRRPLFLGAIVPLALLAGQLSTVVHSMAVEHQVCPEHGELVHRTAVAPAATPLPSDAGPARLASPMTVAGHGHDHCLSLVNRREIVGPPARPAAALLPPADADPVRDRADGAGARGALLALAPKTSPPPSA